MRRPLVGGRVRGATSAGGDTVAQEAQLGEGAVELAGKVEHGLVLLGHVALEPGETFFESVNAFVGHGAGKVGRIWAPRPGPGRSHPG